jgi:dihydrofolate reductase
MPSPSLTLIAAMSRNRVIGRGGALPWRMPADMRRFKQRTMGSAVIMGRKTWDTMHGKALPGRTNIVITRDVAFAADGAVIAHDIVSAIHAAHAAHADVAEVFIVGGSEIYRLALPRADRIDLTVIDADIGDGDAFFPAFEQDASWRLAAEESHPADERHAHAFAFRTYERVRDSDVR